MSGHTPWREIRDKARLPTWEFVVQCPYRPWWGLGLVERTRTMTNTRRASEADARAVLAELRAVGGPLVAALEAH